MRLMLICLELAWMRNVGRSNVKGPLALRMSRWVDFW